MWLSGIWRQSIECFSGIDHFQRLFQSFHFQESSTHLQMTVDTSVIKRWPGRETSNPPISGGIHYRVITFGALHWSVVTHSSKIDLRVEVGSVINQQRDYPIKSGPTTPSIDTNHDSSNPPGKSLASQMAVFTVEILLNAGLNSSDKSRMLEGGNIF